MTTNDPCFLLITVTSRECHFNDQTGNYWDFSLLADSFDCSLGFYTLIKQDALLERPLGREQRAAFGQEQVRNWGPQSNRQQRTECCRHSLNHWVVMEADGTSAHPTGETAGPGPTPALQLCESPGSRGLMSRFLACGDCDVISMCCFNMLHNCSNLILSNR